MLTPDTVLQSRYRVVRQLGQGGMGAVYEAIDERLDSTIALKETFFADERLRKQFEREARLLARMHHPALPRVSDHFSEGEGQFLVMQFIAGDDLAEMSAKRRGPFPVEQVWTWADQLLDALDYLHTQDPQIIHRDIKPQNLKLTPRGQIILLDFGLAKGQASEISRITTSASIFGYTPNYAPLEQIQGLGTDSRSDLYALSATLYHLMTGVKPPDALTRAAAIVNGHPDPLKPAHEVNTSVPASSAGVLQKAMSQNRDQRYASAAEMRRALQAVGAETTVSNRTEADTVLLHSPTPTIAPETNANARQVTVQTDETTVVGEPKETRRRPVAIAAAALALLLAGVGGFYAYQTRNNTDSVDGPVIEQSRTPIEGEPTGGKSSGSAETTDEKQVADDKRQVADDKRQVANDEKVVRKQEKANKQKVADRQREVKAAADEANRARTEVHAKPEQPARPEVPDNYTFEGPRSRQHQSTRRVGNVVIRTFSDGTQLIIKPDGSRIIVSPDGSQQVVRPRQRVNRRRIPARP